MCTRRSRNRQGGTEVVIRNFGLTETEMIFISLRYMLFESECRILISDRRNL